MLLLYHRRQQNELHDLSRLGCAQILPSNAIFLGRTAIGMPLSPMLMLRVRLPSRFELSFLVPSSVSTVWREEDLPLAASRLKVGEMEPSREIGPVRDSVRARESEPWLDSGPWRDTIRTQ